MQTRKTKTPKADKTTSSIIAWPAAAVFAFSLTQTAFYTNQRPPEYWNTK